MHNEESPAAIGCLISVIYTYGFLATTAENASIEMDKCYAMNCQNYQCTK